MNGLWGTGIMTNEIPEDMLIDIEDYIMCMWNMFYTIPSAQMLSDEFMITTEEAQQVLSWYEDLV